jgi:UDP:flavonoid glycosyltransferase YjiC (YdhE family)
VTTTDAHAPLRVLITLQPGEGHLAPLTGLSRALRDAGHDVVYATSPAFVPRVEAHGERAIGVGLDWLMGDGPVEDVDPTRRVDEQPTYFARLFLRDSALEMASDLLGLVDDLRPDVIVRDSVEFAGAAVAERRGLPLATFDLTFPIDHHVMITTGDVHDDTELDGLRDHVGLPPATDPDWFRGSLRISTFPEGYGRSEADASTVRIRPETAPSSGEAPSWVSDLDGAVYVTLGTVFASAAPEVLAAAAHGAAGTGRPTVVTRGNLTEGDWGPPDAEHVRVERFVPQTQVLERSAAAVVHGGTGTTVGALAHGVPLVIVPLGADARARAPVAEVAPGCGSGAAVGVGVGVRVQGQSQRRCGVVAGRGGGGWDGGPGPAVPADREDAGVGVVSAGPAVGVDEPVGPVTEPGEPVGVVIATVVAVAVVVDVLQRPVGAGHPVGDVPGVDRGTHVGRDVGGLALLAGRQRPGPVDEHGLEVGVGREQLDQPGRQGRQTPGGAQLHVAGRRLGDIRELHHDPHQRLRLPARLAAGEVAGGQLDQAGGTTASERGRRAVGGGGSERVEHGGAGDRIEVEPAPDPAVEGRLDRDVRRPLVGLFVLVGGGEVEQVVDGAVDRVQQPVGRPAVQPVPAFDGVAQLGIHLQPEVDRVAGELGGDVAGGAPGDLAGTEQLPRDRHRGQHIRCGDQRGGVGAEHPGPHSRSQ